jgi:hypothetical protein
MAAKTCLRTSTFNPGALSLLKSMNGGKENVISRNGSAAAARPPSAKTAAIATHRMRWNEISFPIVGIPQLP